MTRTKNWDESFRTKCPGTKWRSRSWTSGPLLLPHEPTHPLNIYLIYYFTILNTFRFQKFTYWPVDYKSLPKERFCVSARKFPGPLQLLYGTRSSSPTRYRIIAFVRTSIFSSRDYQWSPTMAWLPLVPIGIIYFNESVAIGHHWYK